MRCRAAALAVLLGLAYAPAAAQVWELSPAEWSAGDLRRILNDSPWAQQISTRAVWRTPGYEGPEVRSRIEIGQLPRPGLEDPSDAGLPPRRGEERATLVVRWASAWTIRAAEAVEAGRTPGEFRPGRRLAEIELVLYPDPMYGFPEFRVVELQQNTWLTLRSTDQRIQPGRMEVRRERDGTLRSISFFFRRLDERGEPWLRPDESQVDFTARVGLASFRARFHPRRMVRAGVPDL